MKKGGHLPIQTRWGTLDDYVLRIFEYIYIIYIYVHVYIYIYI